MSLRLRVMPLTPAFGEYLEHPLRILHPRVQMIFTRDYRIFSQFSHFFDYDRESERPKSTIEVNSLLSDIKIVVVSEGLPTKHTREDDMGCKMVWVSAKQFQTLVMPADASPTNKGVKAYVDQLPEDTPIILAWE